MKPHPPIPTPIHTSTPFPNPPNKHTTLAAQNKRLRAHIQLLRAQLDESEKGRRSYRQNNTELVQRVVQLKREREGLREERRVWLDEEVERRAQRWRWVCGNGGRRWILVDEQKGKKRCVGVRVQWVVVDAVVVFMRVLCVCGLGVWVMALLVLVGWCKKRGLERTVLWF
jgi:hypothetical protein